MCVSVFFLCAMVSLEGQEKDNLKKKKSLEHLF
jgi:hypothetical protein